MTERTTAKESQPSSTTQIDRPRYSWRRLKNKLLQFAARKLPFMPPRWRVQLQSWRGVNFEEPSSTFIGEDVYFDDLFPEKIFVGRQTVITEGVRILAHFVSVPQERLPSAPYGFYSGYVRVGKSVFIGTGAVICKPLTIGDGALVGANAVVTTDVLRNTLVAGAPAKLIRHLPAVAQN